MIKERGASGNPMTSSESFEDFYMRKLEAIRIQLKAIIKGDTPYITSAEYNCKICSGRIKLHSQGRIYCLFCQAPPTWSKDLKRSVFSILLGYPSLEESRKEWEPAQVPQPKPIIRISHSAFSPEMVELGNKIREARQRLNMSHEALARKIHKKDGCHISRVSIQGYELGRINPPKYILEQIEAFLKIESNKDVK